MYFKSVLKRLQIGLVLFGLLTVFSANSQSKKDAVKLNDAQIAHIAVVANQIDVDYGKVARQKSDNFEVKKFAETMIRDHESIIDQATALAAKLGVTPEDNDISKSLIAQQRETLKLLKSANKKDFARIYIDNEVAYHQAVIDAVRNVLIPQTQNEELKQTLIKVMPLLEHHLHMAQEAQNRIK